MQKYLVRLLHGAGRMLLLAMALLMTACSTLDGASRSQQAPEILWDTWGVPHIYASDNRGLFRALGWAQAKSHGNLILEFYGQARGRAAEYWGKEGLDSDRWVRTMGIYDRSRHWYEQQSPEFRTYLDAFAAGINQYAAQHADQLSERSRRVLPVTAIDVIAHTQRVIHFSFLARQTAVVQAREHVGEAGSNAWAIGPARSESGHAMLLINPHLGWSGNQLFYEVHLNAPGVDTYGATLLGFPVISLGFNHQLGWTHTVNTLDGADSFELILEQGGYQFDGKVRSFDVEQQTLRIRLDDGTFVTQPLTIRHAVHGPVIAEHNGKAVAYRVAGLDAPQMLQEWWEMGLAKNLEGFEAALGRLQVPMFNVLYADRSGHILYVFNGRVPRRVGGTYRDWLGIVPGASSANLWTDVLRYDELPRVLDPKSGWLQNANDPPWTSTFPSPLDPPKFPSYLAPQFMHFRAQQSASLLAADSSISLEELVRYKHSTRMLLADRLVDDLIAAARQYGNSSAKQAADVLSAWDHSANADSQGGVIFEHWAERMKLAALSFAFDDATRQQADATYVVPWDRRDPFRTPRGLKAPERAAQVLGEVAEEVFKQYGSLAVPWGAVHRLRSGAIDLPASGGDGDPLGLFRTVWFSPPGSDGRATAVGGDSFYGAVEFSEPVQARVLLAYGNATQPGSAHVGDQLPLFARGEMRTAWLTRSDVEAHLESKERLSTNGLNE